MSAWWIVPAVMIGAMIGFGVCALLTNGKVTDLEAEIYELRRGESHA